ncbi:response regulator [Basilea psittacipulmonis]|uniref:Transcriptional regulator n=1 Tax=Basilea psittacipulmonis DSM 24701 TaxID=1072685 RepID=A0A077DGP3_9BURK|nr:response regulator [Basilea psittacipulmonis]AIL32328.1 transcriptional regulator [Basilea psittacipulmonis DSM 24701]
MRVLLVEDDQLIANGIKVGLQASGFLVDSFEDGQSAVHAIEAAAYDAVVLDLTLPKLDGLEVLKIWRQRKIKTPVLILTARDALDERVQGLQLGADDYLCKPFELLELTARLQALIRRSHGYVDSVLSHQDVVMNMATRTVTLKGEPLNLTSKEYHLLSLFLLNPESVLTREFIEEKLYSWDDEVSSNALEVYIHHLRKKLGNTFIKTVHGVGYTLGKA